MSIPNLDGVRSHTNSMARCFDSGDYGLSEAKKCAKHAVENNSSEEIEVVLNELFNFIYSKGRDSLRKQCPLAR